MPWFIAVLIAVDQLANAVLAGSPDETLSARAHRSAVLDSKPKRRWVIARSIINSLFFLQDDHCRDSYDSEAKRRQLPGHYSREAINRAAE